MGDDTVGAVRDELVHIGDRLGDLAYDELRRAVDAGETSRPELERRLTRARHAVERAVAILGGPASVE